MEYQKSICNSNYSTSNHIKSEGLSFEDFYAIISSSNNKKNEVNNLSAIIMYYNEKGAILVSDSRETNELEIIDDKCQKIFFNKNIIVGIIGLYTSNNINFKEIISNGLLNGKTIEEIMNEKYNGITLQNLIPIDKQINIFYAKKNGEVGVYDIFANSKLENKINKKQLSGVWRNIPNKLNCLYNGLCERYAIVGDKDKPKDYKKMFLFSMNQIIRFESELEKISHVKSVIGGKTQIATINFNN